MTVLRSVIAAVLMAGWSLSGIIACAAAPDGALAPALFGRYNIEVAQQDPNGSATPRILGAPGYGSGGSDWRAAKAARGCASGGTVLRVDPSGGGYDVRVLVGSQVVVVRVDASGHCR